MKKLKTIIPVLIFIMIFSFAFEAKAGFFGNTSKATFLISPESGTFSINDTFKVNIYVNTAKQNVNAVGAFLIYDKAHLQVLNIDTAGSVFSMVAETKVDANAGKIKISLGIPTPGINTANGLVAGIVFKALAGVNPGVDNLKFDFKIGDSTKSGVFLNDGVGTNILTGVYGAKFQIGENVPISYTEGAIIKQTGGSKIYVIKDGKKLWVPTAEIFNLNGYNWDDINVISAAALNAIPQGDNLSSPLISEGALIRAKGGMDVYIVKYVGAKRFKRLVLSPSVFNSYGHLKWSNIMDVDQPVVNSFVTSDLVRAENDTKVYRLTPLGDTGQRLWIQTLEQFINLGLDWDSIYQINAIDRDSYMDIVS